MSRTRHFQTVARRLTAKGGGAAPMSAKRKKAAAARRRPKGPFTRAEIKTFREMLIQKRSDVLGDILRMEGEALGAGGGRNGGRTKMPTHQADVATDAYEQEFTLVLLSDKRALLGDIDEALLRIERGTYGICLETGRPIGKARLTARPWAIYSIEYARMQEQGRIRPDTPERRRSHDRPRE